MGTLVCQQFREAVFSRSRKSAKTALVAMFFALFAWAPNLNAQTGTITGRVIDSGTNQPLASAQVVISNLNLGVLTQQNGRFILLNVPAGTHTVSVQRIGFRSASAPVTVVAGESVTQDFSISEEALALDEIIVTGTPGGSQRRAIGNSVERVQAAEITEKAVITSMQDLMAARTPGLRFGTSPGQVGGGSGITIRGVTSVSLGSQPLIYVDGVRVDNDATKGPDTGSSQGASALNDLNPEEIESIEVIKGPAAATLYGTEASAGVIQIITKKGNVGAPEFTLEVAQGTNFMVDPAGILGTQYACKTSVPQCPADQIVQVNMYDEANDYLRRQGRFEGLDNGFAARDADLFGYGHSQRYSLSARGGSEQVRYYLSGTFGDDVGIIDYNTDQSTNLRANVTVLLPGNLNLDVNTGYGQGDTRFATVDSEGGVWHQLVWARPNQLPGVRTASGTNFLGFQERWPENFENTMITRDYSRFTGSATTTHSVGDWLTQRLVFGVDRSWETNTEFLPGGNNIPEAPRGALNYGRPLEQNITFDYALSGRWRPMEMLGTTTSFGAQYYSNFTENFSAYGTDFPTSVQTVIDQTSFGNRQLDFSSVENKSLGFYVQEELAIRDRLYLTGAVRADDNSAFGSEFDLQYYPKVSASWVVSEESFFNLGLVDNLRLRGAWGQSGRQPSTFAGQTLYTTFLGPNGNGLIPSSAGNPDVGPEVSSELELGFDVALLDQRLSGQFSWYSTTTEDMLVNQSLAPSTGLTGSRQTNLGSMKSSGWEASLNARLIESSNLALDMDFAGDYTHNEILSLGEGVLPTGNFQIGWPYPNISTDYYLVDAKLNAAGTALDRSTVMCDLGRPAVDGGPNIMQGGEVGPCSQYHEEGILLGPAYPNYTFHVGPTVTVMNNLQVYALAEGQYGRWIASVDAEYACRVYGNCLVAVERTNPLWLAANGGGYVDDRYRGRFQSDFWKLRQVGLRYSLPQSMIRFAGVDRAAFTFSANNVLRIWQSNDTDAGGAPIYDPDYSINGGSPQQTALWEMPGIASLNASLRVTF